MVELLFCKQRVAGSSPAGGSLVPVLLQPPAAFEWVQATQMPRRDTRPDTKGEATGGAGHNRVVVGFMLRTTHAIPAGFCEFKHRLEENPAGVCLEFNQGYPGLSQSDNFPLSCLDHISDAGKWWQSGESPEVDCECGRVVRGQAPD